MKSVEFGDTPIAGTAAETSRTAEHFNESRSTPVKQVVDSAMVPTTSVAPSRSIMILGVSAFGALAVICCILMRDNCEL
jgi:hypothetical protein